MLTLSDNFINVSLMPTIQDFSAF